MKVLFITNIPSPYRVDFFNELGKFCDLTVIFEKEKSDHRDSNWYSSKFNNFSYVFLNRNMGNNYTLSLSISKYLKNRMYDIYIVGGYSTPTEIFSILLLKLKKIPFIISTDGGLVKNDNRLKYLIKSYLIKSANYLLSTGQETNKYLSHYGADLKHVCIYPFSSIYKNDVLKKPASISEKHKLREKLRIPKEKMIILSVGRFIYEKGYDVLFNALSELDYDYCMYIIGGNPPQEYIEQIKRLNLKNITFVKFLEKSNLRDYYLASDLFVLPTRGDVWGLVINEAMSCGLPIITTDKCVAGIELIKDFENGFIVPTDNSREFAKAVKFFICNPDKLKNMSAKSLEKINDYTIENMAKNHIDIFNRILIEERKQKYD